MVLGSTKKMIVSIHQPSYFPWLGLLDKINKSDLFVILNDVQLTDRAYQHRNLFIKNFTHSHLLTIPIEKKGYRQKPLNTIMIADSKWQKKHLHYLQHNYKHHPYFDEIFPLLEPFFQKKYRFVYDALIDSMQIVFEIFDIKTPFIASSSLPHDRTLCKEAQIIDIVKLAKGDIYLSRRGAQDYQKEENFKKNSIELCYQEFSYPNYKQHKNGGCFIEELSSLDIAFNLGKKEAQLLLKGAL